MLKRVSIVAFLLAAPAFAQTDAPPPKSQQLAASPAKENSLDKIVCKVDDTSGSRLKRHKVCATVREWQEQQAENREALERLQLQGQSVPH